MQTHSANPDEEILLDQPYTLLEKSIKEIDNIGSIGKDIIKFSVDSLADLAENLKRQQQYGVERKIQNTISALNNIDESSPELGKKFKTIRSQSLVLLVSNFERFLRDFTVVLAEEYSYLIEWPDQKLSIDFSSFKYGRPSLGEVVLRAFRDKYSFQDLRSITDFSDKLFRVPIVLKKSRREKIVLYHAMRHAIVHNLGLVDDQFLKQIRETEFSHNYFRGDEIKLSEEDYIEAKGLFLGLAKEIYVGVRKGVAPF